MHNDYINAPKICHCLITNLGCLCLMCSDVFFCNLWLLLFIHCLIKNYFTFIMFLFLAINCILGMCYYLFRPTKEDSHQRMKLLSHQLGTVNIGRTHKYLCFSYLKIISILTVLELPFLVIVTLRISDIYIKMYKKDFY